MIRKIFSSGVLQLLALFLLMAAALYAMPRLLIDGDPVHLYDVRLLGVSEDGRAELGIYGGNLFRVNTLYLDEKEARDAEVQSVSYEECRIFVDANRLEGVSRVRVAKRIAGFAELRSYAVDVNLQNAQTD